MSLHSEIKQFASEAKCKIKKVPFLYFVRAYEGIIKEIELKRTSFNTSNSLLRLQAFWVDRVKEMKKHPEPTQEKQLEQDVDCQRITDCNYRIANEVIMPIRLRKHSEIKLEALKDMARLMRELTERYGQS